MQDEAEKIMHLPEFRVSATCVRVPVHRAHSVAVSAEFERSVSVEQAREVLAKAPGLELVDEPQSNRYPMPLAWREMIIVRWVGCDLIAHLRTDSRSGYQAISCSKAQHLNAVQIAELL